MASSGCILSRGSIALVTNLTGARAGRTLASATTNAIMSAKIRKRDRFIGLDGALRIAGRQYGPALPCSEFACAFSWQPFWIYL